MSPISAFICSLNLQYYAPKNPLACLCRKSKQMQKNNEKTVE